MLEQSFLYSMEGLDPSSVLNLQGNYSFVNTKVDFKGFVLYFPSNTVSLILESLG